MRKKAAPGTSRPTSAALSRSAQGPASAACLGLLNRAGAAKLLGCSLTTLTKWIEREGMPVVRRGSRRASYQFDPAAIVRWEIERARAQPAPAGGPTLLGARTRKALAEADLAELHLSRELGEVVSVDEVVAIERRKYAAIGGFLRAFPARMAPIVAPETNPGKVRDLLRQEVDSAIREMRIGEDDAGEAPEHRDDDSRSGGHDA
jgi:phage terminase Nu1 subunit (DNA packaging protein)